MSNKKKTKAAKPVSRRFYFPSSKRSVRAKDRAEADRLLKEKKEEAGDVNA